MKNKVKELSAETGRRVASLFNNAYSDYLGARLLISSNQLRDACFLANTAIEKYIKALNAIAGDNSPQTHDITSSKLLNPLENKHKIFYDQLNLDFLGFLAHSYQMRYLDSLPDDFNIVIANKKLLAELDTTVGFIEDHISYHEKSVGERKRKYEIDKEERNPVLMAENCYQLGVDQQEFVDTENKVYEARMHKVGGLIEAMYTTNDMVSDKPFMVPGLVETVVNKSFQMFYKANQG